jgi:hypothetical protein
VSTFGKKSLVWWDYNDRERESLRRFNLTPKPLQLQILEKWYPVGMLCGLQSGKSNYKNLEYVEHTTWYSVRVELISEGSLLNGMRNLKNPLSLYPESTYEKQIKRSQKIDRLV